MQKMKGMREIANGRPFARIEKQRFADRVFTRMECQGVCAAVVCLGGSRIGTLVQFVVVPTVQARVEISRQNPEKSRAYAMTGETGKAKAAYEDFLQLWKEADRDLLIGKEARAEYARRQ
jgi:hypothetical protein